MSDRAGSTVPGRAAVAVDVSSANQTVVFCRGVYVGGAGDLVVDMAGEGKAVTFAAVPAGSLLPIQVSKIYSAANGTSATNLVVIY